MLKANYVSDLPLYKKNSLLCLFQDISKIYIFSYSKVAIASNLQMNHFFTKLNSLSSEFNVLFAYKMKMMKHIDNN